jgi:hypothetical protein
MLQEEQETHDILQEELLTLTANLKENVTRINQALSEDGKLLTAAEDVIDKNVADATTQNRRLQLHLDASTRGTLLTWCSFITVAVVFVAMYLLIRLVPASR